MPSASSKNDATHAEKSDKKTSQLLDYVESLVAANEQHELSTSFLVDLIDERFEQLSSRLEQQIGKFCESMVPGQNNGKHPSLENSTCDKVPDPAGEEDLSQLSGWDLKKRELLVEHGCPVEPLPQKIDKSPLVTPPPVNRDEPETMVALHESIESINNIDAEEIEVLKEQLTSKLRDAEVELSINRAKLSQQWASLEQRQYEIAQRESMLENKYGNLDEPAKKQGLLDRLSRHLSRKPDDTYKE